MQSKIMLFLINTNAINIEDVEIYQYGLGLFVKKIIHVLTILFLGAISDELVRIMLFIMVYAGIRKYSGGYHANTSLGCFFCTVGITGLTIILLKVLVQVNFVWNVFSIFVCGLIISKLSPQEAANKPLSLYEKEIYQRKTREYLIFYSFLALFGFYWPIILPIFSCAFGIQVLMLLLRIYQKNKVGC